MTLLNLIRFLRSPSKFVRCSVPAYLRQKRLTFLATEVPVSGYYFAGRPAFFTGRVPLLISRLRLECFLPPPPTGPSRTPLHFLSYNALFTRILLVDKFLFLSLSLSCLFSTFFFLSFSLHVPRESRGEERPSTFPHRRATVPERTRPRFGARVFGACEVSPPHRLSRGQVRFTRMRTLCRP